MSSIIVSFADFCVTFSSFFSGTITGIRLGGRGTPALAHMAAAFALAISSNCALSTGTQKTKSLHRMEIIRLRVDGISSLLSVLS